MACYFIPIPCASSGTKRRTHRTEERQQTRPNALCRQRYYRTWRPVLPPGGTTALCYRQQQTTPAQAKCSLSPAVLPAPDPVLPGHGTTAPCYRHQQTAPAEAPGPQAVLPVPERYYRTKRYYRSQVRYYRPLLPPPTEGPSASPRTTSGTTGQEAVLPHDRYYRSGWTGTTGPGRA